MQLKTIALALLTSILFSCNTHTPTPPTPAEVAKATPKILKEKARNASGYLSKGRKHTNVVISLYEEALSRDESLQKLQQTLQELEQLKYDSLQTYQEYAQINASYWRDAQSYMNQISDSTLRQATIAQFDKIQETYETKVNEHEQLRDRIQAKTKELSDQVILLKLAISHKMIQNYQKNELPDVDALEVILGQYNKMIKETGEFAEIGE